MEGGGGLHLQSMARWTDENRDEDTMEGERKGT